MISFAKLNEINLHLETESHFCLNTGGKNLKHELNEALLVDTTICCSLGGDSMESVTDDAWQVDILYKGHLVDRFRWIALRLGRSEGEICEHTRKVWTQLLLDKLRVDIRVEVLHIQQIDKDRLVKLLLWNVWDYSLSTRKALAHIRGSN